MKKSRFTETQITKILKDYEAGHTPTIHWDSILQPMKLCNLWVLDQGAGFDGKLTLMNMDNHKYWQSDQVTQIYHRSSLR